MAATPSTQNGFIPERLRLNEWVIGAAALVLLISMFLTWYGVRGDLAYTFNQLPHGPNGSGWSSFRITDVFIAACIFYGLATWFTQAYCRAPAVPVVMTVLLFPTSIITALLVFHRVVIDKPGANDLVSLRPFSIVGLISIIVLAVFAYRSLRQDGIREADGPGEIETFRQRRRPVGAA